MLNWLRQIVGPSKVPGGNKPQTYFLLGSWAVFAFLGLVIPEDVLTKNEWAREFTDFMAAIVPQIDRITALGLKPEINRFHYSVLWAVAPVYFIVALMSANKNIVLGYHRLTIGQIALGLLGGAYFIGFAMFLWLGPGLSMDDPRNRIERIVFYYSVSRAVWAPIFASGPVVLAGGLIAMIKGMLTGDIYKKGKEGNAYGRH